MEGTVLHSVAQFVILPFFTGPNRVSSMISPAPSGVKALKKLLMEETVLQSVAQFVILLFFTGPNRVSSMISPAPSGVKAHSEMRPKGKLAPDRAVSPKQPEGWTPTYPRFPGDNQAAEMGSNEAMPSIMPNCGRLAIVSWLALLTGR